tara:strand:+ start:290 stop:499 length:210 start_codon:yes stop_codon:yes gene_type:complete
MTIFSEPDVPLEPCHAPDAEQEDEFEDDQVNVTDDDSETEVDEAENEITGGEVTGSGEDPPPPPPPPHA